MINTLAQYFAIIGLNITPPTNMAELFPYLLTVCLGFALIGGIFKLFSKITIAIMSGGGRL